MAFEALGRGGARVRTRSNAAAVFLFLAKVSELARAWQKGARRDRSTSSSRRCIPRAFDAFLRDLMHPRAFAIPPGAVAVRWITEAEPRQVDERARLRVERDATNFVRRFPRWLKNEPALGVSAAWNFIRYTRTERVFAFRENIARNFSLFSNEDSRMKRNFDSAILDIMIISSRCLCKFSGKSYNVWSLIFRNVLIDDLWAFNMAS